MVSVAVPLFPALVATIVTDGAGEIAVTTPDAETVALGGEEDCQVIVRAVRTLPCASRNLAVSCNESPWTSVLLAGVTSTVATGASTSTTVASLTPPAVARTVAIPDEAAVTTPAPVTAATEGELDVHCTANCAGLQCCAVTAAVSVMVSPTMTARLTCET